MVHCPAAVDCHYPVLEVWIHLDLIVQHHLVCQFSPQRYWCLSHDPLVILTSTISCHHNTKNGWGLLTCKIRKWTHAVILYSQWQYSHHWIVRIIFFNGKCQASKRQEDHISRSNVTVQTYVFPFHLKNWQRGTFTVPQNCLLSKCAAPFIMSISKISDWTHIKQNTCAMYTHFIIRTYKWIGIQ